MAGQLIRDCINDTRSKPTARLVLLILAERANGNRYCWPSIASLAKDTGLTERSVRKSLNELRDLGEIHTQHIARRRTLGYLIVLGLTEEQIAQRLSIEPFCQQAQAVQLAKSLVALQKQTEPQKPKAKQVEKKPRDRNVVPGNVVPLDTGTTFRYTPEPNSPPYEPSLEPEVEPDKYIAVVAPKSNGKKAAENLTPKPAKPLKPIQPHVAIIDAWHAAIPEKIRPPGKPAYGGQSAKYAVAMCKDGITPDQVTAYMQETYPGYLKWADQDESRPKVMSLTRVCKEIKAWLNKGALIVERPSYQLSPEEQYRQLRQEREQRIMQSPREQYEAEKRRKEGVK